MERACVGLNDAPITEPTRPSGTNQAEEGLPIDLVRNTPRKLPEGDIPAVNNAFGFGGHNVALDVQNF